MPPRPPPAHDDIEAAVAAVQRGDHERYGDVVRYCTPSVRAWVRMRCPCGIDPDEIAHQAFIAAFGQIGEYRPGERFLAWILGFARNMLLNECRAARRRETRLRHYAEVAWLEAGERDLAAGGDPDDDARILAVRACLDGLREDARDLVALRYSDDLAIEAIARRTGRSQGAIAKSLHLIRRRLQDCITVRLGGAVR